MSQKRLVRAFGAGTLAMATVVSGLSFGSAAVAAPTSERASTATTKTKVVFKNGSTYYGVKYASANGITNVKGYVSGSLASATAGADEVTVVREGDWFRLKSGSTTCLNSTYLTAGSARYPAVSFGQCYSSGGNSLWKLQGGTLVNQFTNAAVGGLTSFTFDGPRYDFLKWGENWQFAGDASAFEDPVANGGVKSEGVGFPTSLNVGETKDLYFGLESTGNLNSLNPATYELRAPAGTKFVSGATKSEYREGTTWLTDPNSPATLTVLDGGARATVTITTRNDWGRPAGKQARWAVPILGVSAANGNVSFTGTGTSNLGSFSTSGQSGVTVSSPTSNGGVAPTGLGFPTSIQQGETKEVPIGLKATDGYSSPNASLTLTAPDGTTFPDQSTVPGQWREGGGTWSANVDDLGLTNIRISSDRRTLTADFNPSSFGGQPKDAELRWLPKLTASSSAAAGTRGMAFTATGTTNQGAFTSNGSSAVTIVQTEAPGSNGGLSSTGVGFSTSIEQNETKDVPFGLRADAAINALSFQVTLNAPAGTTFADQTTIDGQRRSQNGSWSGNDSALALSDIQINADRTRLVAQFDPSSFGALSAGSELRWLPELTAASDATVGTRDMRTSFLAATDLGSARVNGTSAVTVTAAPVSNGGVEADTPAFPLSLKVGETKDFFFGLEASSNLSAGTTVNYRVTIPAGAQLANGPVKAQKRNADGTWSDDANSRATVTVDADGRGATLDITTVAGWSLPTGGEYRWGLPLTGLAAGSGDAALFARGTTSLGQFVSGNTARVEITDVAALVANVDSVDNAARTAQLSGTAEPGAQVKYGATVIGTAGADGRWSGQVTGLNVGTQTLTLDQVIGNVTAGSTTVDITVTAPVVNGGVEADTLAEPLSLKVGETKDLFFGLQASGDLTAGTTATFQIGAPAGTRLSDGPVKAQKRNADGTWSDDANSTATVTVGANGSTASLAITTAAGWSLPASGEYRWALPLTGTAAGSGNASFFARGTTNLGEFISGNTARVDVTDVAALVANVDSVDNAARTAQLSGTAEPGAQVKYGATVIGTAGADGRWSGQVTGLTLGAQTLTLDQFVGSVKAGSTTVNVTVAPVSYDFAIQTPANNAVIRTADKQVTFRGTGQPGGKVSINFGTRVIGSVIVAADGTWEFTATMNYASYDLTAYYKKAANGSLTSTTPWHIDVVNSADNRAFAITTPADNAVINAPDKRVVFRGEGTTEGVVTIKQGSRTVGTTTVGPDGTWEIPGEFSAFTTYNLSVYYKKTPASGVLTTPWHITLTDGAIVNPFTVSSPTDGSVVETADKSVTFSGQGAGNGVISIMKGNQKIAGGTVGQNGTWEFTGTLNYGEHTVTVFHKPLGASKAEQKQLRLTVDRPSASFSVTSPQPGATVAAGDIPFVGEGKNGGVVSVFVNNRKRGESTVAGGAWTVPVNITTPGTHSVSVYYKSSADAPSAERMDYTITVQR